MDLTTKIAPAHGVSEITRIVPFPEEDSWEDASRALIELANGGRFVVGAIGLEELGKALFLPTLGEVVESGPGRRVRYTSYRFSRPGQNDGSGVRWEAPSDVDDHEDE